MKNKRLQELFGVDDDFADACEHDHFCDCQICLDWWVTMYDPDDGSTGGFTEDEILEARARRG